MKKSQSVTLLTSIMLISFSLASASAEILNPKIAHATVSSLASIYGKTYPLQVDNKTYPIFYGFNLTYASATNILLVPEHNSMQISLKGVTKTDAMWIQFPQNLISAEKDNFVLYVDGQEKKYEFATSDHSTVMGFMIPTNATLVEIQGTHVVPEFPITAIYAMMISFTSIILVTRIVRK